MLTEEAIKPIKPYLTHYPLIVVSYHDYFAFSAFSSVIIDKLADHLLIMSDDEEAPAAITWIEAPQFGKAYHLAENKMTMKEAKNYCAALGGRLLLPQSKTENDFVRDRFKKKINLAWIDVKKDAMGKYNTTDGKAINWSNWQASDKKRENAAFLCFEAPRAGFWISYSDYDWQQMETICEKDLKGPIAGGSPKIAAAVPPKVEKDMIAIKTQLAKLEKQGNSIENNVLEAASQIHDRMDTIETDMESKFDQLVALMGDAIDGVNTIKVELNEIKEQLAAAAEKEEKKAKDAEQIMFETN